MAANRRTFVRCGLSLLAGTYLTRWSASAHSAEYVYDSRGRLIQVLHGDGTSTIYEYDAAGNRTAAGARAPVPPPVPFVRTIVIPASTVTPCNLNSLARSAGYNGKQPAQIAFDLPSGVALTGAPGSGIAIDTGTWPIDKYPTVLTLRVAGKVWGGGGRGGAGAGVAEGASGGNGGAGGDAVNCQVPIAIEIASGGEIIGGGGGGGGGAQSPRLAPIIGPRPGAGGGGGFPNGPSGFAGYPLYSPGWPGTPSGGGAGGIGFQNISGDGGAGGGAGAAGFTGGSTASTLSSPGSGGPPGYAIRKNGHQVSIVNGGTIVGAQG